MDSIILKIRQLQDDRKINTKELAKEIGLTPQAIYDLFNEKTTLSIKNLIKFSNYFQKPISYFFEDENTTNIKISNTSGNQSINSVVSGAGAEEIKMLKERIKLLEDRITELNQLVEQKDQMIEKLFKIHE